jgi:phosphoglycolate phosphatase
MQPRAVLFDKDGTLIGLFSTWIPAYSAAAEHVAQRAGIPGLARKMLLDGGLDDTGERLLPDTLLACGSNGQIVDAWMRHPAVAKLDNIREEILQIFHVHTVHSPQPVTDLHTLFTQLKARGLILGVATMDGTASANETLIALGIDHLVDFTCGYDAGFGVKPAPGMALAFSEAVGVPMAEILVVGDAIKDMKMAKSAGALGGIGVLTGAADEAVLQPHADAVIDSIADLVALLDRAY